MAVLARRTWAQLATETTLRLGNIASPGFDSRVQYWLAASYFDLCTRYHHVELDMVTASALTLSVSTSSLNLPADLFVLISASIESTTIPIIDFRSVVHDIYDNAAGVPQKCARFGSKLYFDRIAGANYPTVFLWYYRRGTSPDFTTPTSPELDSDVDEHIIEGALRYAYPNLARPDLGAVQRELLNDWLSTQVRTPTSYPLTSLAERERSATTLSGTQG